MPVHSAARIARKLGIVGRRGRRHEPAGDAAEDRDDQHAGGRELGVVAAVRALEHQQAAEDRPAEDRDIGAGLDQPGPAEHFVLFEVLRQDRIFDRAEEGRVDAHRGQRGEQQRDIVEQQPGGAEQHDPDFRAFDDAHDLRLVIGVGQLAGKRGQQEEGGDEQAAGDRAEGRFLLGVAVDAVDDQHHHRGAEQIVVEGAQELGHENRQEPARPDADGLNRASISSRPIALLPPIPIAAV